MIYKIFLKLMSRHLWFHLLVPLIVGVGVEILIAWAPWHQPPSGISLHEYLISPERIGLYAGIFVTYLLIAGWLVNKEAKPRMTRATLTILDDTLKDATTFFATCTIPLRGWFEPYTQQYFSHIVRRRLAEPEFVQERVLLFLREGDLKKAREQYLDGLYANPLAEIHRNYGIDLGFLRRAEINEVLAKDAIDKVKLGCYPRWIAWWPTAAQWHLSRKRRIRGLDFALITHVDVTTHQKVITVYLFSKKHEIIVLDKVKGPDKVKPYEDLIEAIRAKVFEGGRLDRNHDFSQYVG
ncbi:MAG: hypothetical protein QOE96_2779 [Blastocatellia bacterium]|nr:hypothetical protein [Blastocatellia bacterium]